MLETDCIIPQHVPIPHDPVTLYGDARAVRALQQDGLGKWAIIKKLRISEDAYKDAIYEINKQNAITELNHYYEKENEEMPRGEKLDAETVERIREMKAAGKTVKEITEEVGCGISTVGRVCQRGKSQINEEFDNAVNQMIEESKPQEIVQANEPVMMTEEHTAAVPDAVIEAVREQLASHELFVADNLQSIRKLQQENEQYRTKIAALKKWLAEVTV